MINLYPQNCNLCGSKVIYTTNDKVYGKRYGSGYCYLCTNCGAFVGTHKPRPREAMGILANEEMRDLRKQCHTLFDRLWKSKSQRNKCYSMLAKKLNIPATECHFGYFDKEQLETALTIIKEVQNEGTRIQ